jgi:cellulose synthase (UDP-forming)
MTTQRQGAPILPAGPGDASLPVLPAGPGDASLDRRQAAGLATLLAIADAGTPIPERKCRPHRHSTRAAYAMPLRQRLLNGLMVAIGLALAGAFALFWFGPARLPHDFGGGFDAGDIILFALLSVVVWHRQSMDIIGWLICSRVEAHHESPRPPRGLRVAFITTFVPSAESLEMLRRTLAHMTVADYPHDTWLLDEGNDPEARAVCNLLGVKYFSRSGMACFNAKRGRFLARSKAGNHNAWYEQYADHYDIVAQVDSDFRVRKDFLTKTIGHFANPRVAFVGTPQIYGNTHNWIARGAAQQTYLFYGAIMRALSRRRMTLLIGANHVVRVAALRDIGWYQGHLTEDLATGKRFHARRWESIYVPEPLAIGEGPGTWASYFNQQYRWAFGCMNIFFTHSPRLNIRMRLNHALYYFLMEQFYFSGMTMIMAISLLLIYYLTGWVPGNIPVWQLAFWYLPLFAWRQVMVLWLQRFNVRPKEERGMFLAARLLTIAVIPVYFLALVGVLRNRRVTFKTTPKGGQRDGDADNDLRLFRPHLMLSGLIVAGMILAFLLGHRIWVFFAWGSVTAGLLSMFAFPRICRRLASSLRWRRTVPRHVPAIPRAAAAARPAIVPSQREPVRSHRKTLPEPVPVPVPAQPARAPAHRKPAPEPVS